MATPRRRTKSTLGQAEQLPEERTEDLEVTQDAPTSSEGDAPTNEESFHVDQEAAADPKDLASNSEIEAIVGDSSQVEILSESELAAEVAQDPESTSDVAQDPEQDPERTDLDPAINENQDLAFENTSPEFDEQQPDNDEEGDTFEEASVDAEPVSQASAREGVSKPKRPNLIVRLWRRLTSPFRKKPKPFAAASEKVEIFDEKWAKSTLAEIRKLRAQRSAASESAEKIQQELSQFEQEQLRIESWLEALKRSYYWKLEQRMEQNIAHAKTDIAEYEGLVRALELPEKGTLRSLREKFHKGLSINFLSFAFPAFLLYFIPWFSGVDLFAWLVDLLRSPLFILLIVTIGAVVAGVFLLMRRVLGKKKVTTKKTLKWTTIAMLLPAVMYGLFRAKEFLLIVVTPIIEEIRPTALWVILILFVFLTLALLIIYYQGWSVFRRTVTDEVARLENVAAGYVKTRQELARLEFLYGQTIDWMKLLAHTLYRPWKVHPDWKSPNQAQASSESFPMALRVAQAVENDASESAQLRRTIANRLLVQGWRTAAFEKSLSEIGRFLGYEPDKVNPELLDSDLPHQPNNSRKLVLEYFEHSAETAHSGTLDLSNRPADFEQSRAKPDPSDVYLVEVARDHLRYLIDKTQGSALAHARPSVQQIIKNPLAELAESDTESESVEVSRWDDFLAEGLGIEDQNQPPMGVLAFTDEGRKAKSGSGIRSQVLVPSRFSNNLPKARADNLTVVPTEDSEQNQPAEIMLRFDLVGPLPFNQVTLIQKATRSPILEQVEHEENDDL